MLELSNEQLVASLFSVVLPLLVATILRPTWSSQTRVLVSLGVTLVAVVLTQLMLIATTDTPGTWQSWVRFIVSCLVLTGLSYARYLKPAGLTAAVEAATSPDSGPQRQLEAEARRAGEAPREPGGG